MVPEIFACCILLASLVTFFNVLTSGLYIFCKEYLINMSFNCIYYFIWYLWYYLILWYIAINVNSEIMVEIEMQFLLGIMYFYSPREQRA